MTNAYELYEKNVKALTEHAKQHNADVLHYALTGKKPSWVIDSEKREKLLKENWDNIIIDNCCHCGKAPEVVTDIDCGIDGGPSPYTVHGLKIKCHCGMQTDIYHHRCDQEKLEAYIKCSAKWNSLI